jgi:hypothetical protein
MKPAVSEWWHCMPILKRKSAAFSLQTMSGSFRRSGAFGIVGVVGVVATFCLILFALQRSDLERAADAGIAATDRATPEGGRQVDNPDDAVRAGAVAALAVRPIDAEAVHARGEAWGVGRRSQRLAMVVTLSIFLTVPSIRWTGATTRSTARWRPWGSR